MSLNKNYMLIFIFTIFVILFNCDKSGAYLSLSGEYLGQAIPRNSAKIFATGILSTDMYERDFTMTPDGKEIYYTLVLGNNSYSAIVVTRLTDKLWTQPAIADFSKNPKHKDLEPHISPDGEKFYFVSNRPSGDKQDTKENWDIWVMDKTEKGWSDPYNLGPPVNSPAREFFPSVTRQGTIYFTREGPEVNNGIFRAELKDGEYAAPERLPAQVNAGKARYNAYIAPDESYIIIPIYGLPDSYGGTDYYISFHNNSGKWSKPLNMGNQINSSAGGEWSASLSSDEKYIFFMSDRESGTDHFGSKPLTIQRMKKLHQSPYNGNPNIYWIKATIIDSLRKYANL